MIVSVTERQSYKRCRRQWLINSRNRWSMTPIVSPLALSLGTLLHDTLELWLNMHADYQRTGNPNMVLPPGGLDNIFRQLAQKKIDDTRQVYRTQVGAPISDSELAPLWDGVRMGSAMMQNYQDHWKIPVPEGFEIISTEQRVMVPIPGTEHTEEWVWESAASAGTPEGQFVPGYGWIVQKHYDEPQYHYLEGRLDGILRQVKTGRLYVLEHKSYGQRPREDVLFTQDQFLAYHWMLLQHALEMGLSQHDVAGVAYDGLWKRATPPKRVDNHAGTITDLFSRKLITRPVQELVEFEEELATEVKEMANDPAIFKNRTSDGSCFWECNDNQLCLAMSRGEDVDWILRKKYTRKSDADDTELAGAASDSGAG